MLASRLQYLLLIAVPLLLSGCPRITINAFPIPGDIPAGGTADVSVTVLEKDTGKGVPSVTVNFTNSNATCGSLQPTGWSTVSSGKVNPAPVFTAATGLTADCSTTITATATAAIDGETYSESATFVITVHPPILLGHSGTTVSVNTYSDQSGALYWLFEITETEGDTDKVEGQTICILCSKTSKYKWGTQYPEELTISPAPGVKLKLKRLGAACGPCPDGAADVYEPK